MKDLIAQHAPELLLPPREGDATGWVAPEDGAENMYDEQGNPLNYIEEAGLRTFFAPQGSTPTPIRPVGADGIRNRDTDGFAAPTQGPTYTPPQEPVGLELPPETGAPPGVPLRVASEQRPATAPIPRSRQGGPATPPANPIRTLGDFFQSLNIPLPYPGMTAPGRTAPRPVGEPRVTFEEDGALRLDQFDPNTGEGDFMAHISRDADEDEQARRRRASPERNRPDPLAATLGPRRY